MSVFYYFSIVIKIITDINKINFKKNSRLITIKTNSLLEIHMKNFYFLFFSLVFLISSEPLRADGHEEKKVVEEKTEETYEEKEE